MAQQCIVIVSLKFQVAQKTVFTLPPSNLNHHTRYQIKHTRFLNLHKVIYSCHLSSRIHKMKESNGVYFIEHDPVEEILSFSKIQE